MAAVSWLHPAIAMKSLSRSSDGSTAGIHMVVLSRDAASAFQKHTLLG
jgi:hypothetical protein